MSKRFPQYGRYDRLNSVKTFIVAAVAFITMGCTVSTDVPVPVINHITPSKKNLSDVVTVEISGHNFLNRAERNTKGDAAFTVDARFTVRLYSTDRPDNVPYLLTDVAQDSSESLHGTILVDLALGMYSMEVETPFGLTATLPNAFIVENKQRVSDTDSGNDTDTDADTNTDINTETDSDTIMDSEIETDSETDTDSETIIDSDTYFDTQDNMAIILNTSPSGADIVETVYNFPVLIRLDNTNFNFSSANDNGEDVRFFDSSEQPLSYEIERWSSLLNQAFLWVKVPIIYPNNADQYIVMRWGISDTQYSSDSTQVFEPADSFAGVYHMDALNEIWSYQYPDATENDVDGIGYNMNAGSVVNGIAGDAVYFNGNNYITVTGMYGLPQSITLSGWALLNSGGGELITLGNHVNIQFVSTPKEGVELAYCTYEYSVWNTTAVNQSFADTKWYYIVYMVDSVNHLQQAFIDGALVKEDTYTSGINYIYPYRNTIIGAFWSGDSNYLHGTVDELRVEIALRSESWVKLCYENQRPEGQSLVEYP